MSENIIVKRLIEYIESHLNEDLSLDTIAQELNYSKFYISRIFAKETGCTIYKYIQGRRLTQAARKLVETKEPIAWIAYEAHYNSQQAFTLAFRQLYFCTPQTYRKNGAFAPKQPQMNLKCSVRQFSSISHMWGGRMAA